MTQASFSIEHSSVQTLGICRVALQAIVTVQLLGLLLFHYWQEQPTMLANLLYFDLGTSESFSTIVNWGVILGLFTALLSTPFRPQPHLLLSIGGWLILESVIKWYRRDGFLPWVEPIEYAARYMAPICLGYVLLARQSQDQDLLSRRLQQMLRLAAAATFLGHGYVAIEANPHFRDLLLGFFLRTSGWTPPEMLIGQLVFVIGVLDVAVAILLLETRHRWLLLYMTFWGLITAMSRLFYYGIDGLPDALTRIPNGGIPLACLLLCLGSESLVGISQKWSSHKQTATSLKCEP